MARLQRAAYLRMTYLPPIPTEQEYVRFWERNFEQHETWVAEDAGGRVVGVAALGDGELHHIYVDADVQRRGIGSALLAKAQERMPDGFTLWTFQKNEHARAFYRKHGLRELQSTDGGGNIEREPDVQYGWRRD
jgi:ribosomal protein S18 acetylase RimI-like enzyme